MKTHFLIPAILFSTALFAADPSPFIVQNPLGGPAKKSKEALKEEMGDALQDTMSLCSSLQRSLGQLQLELAEIQERMLNTGRSLLNNTGAARTAKRADLDQGLRALRDVADQLDGHTHGVRRASKTLAQAPVLSPTRAKPERA